MIKMMADGRKKNISAGRNSCVRSEVTNKISRK